jgi:V-type H+-transporting ATPase subunit A
MLRNILAFHEYALAALERCGGAGGGAGGAGGARLSYGAIRTRLADLLHKLASQKFDDPADGEAALRARAAALGAELRERFRALEEEYR